MASKVVSIRVMSPFHARMVGCIGIAGDVGRGSDAKLAQFSNVWSSDSRSKNACDRLESAREVNRAARV